MKKLLLAFAAGAFLYSCDLPAGGNKAIIKMSDEQVRYTSANAEEGTFVAPPEKKTTTDSASTSTREAAVMDSAAAPILSN